MSALAGRALRLSDISVDKYPFRPHYAPMNTKKRIGRPPRPDGPAVRISTRVPGAVAEAARRRAEREGVTVGELARVALVEFLK